MRYNVVLTQEEMDIIKEHRDKNKRFVFLEPQFRTQDSGEECYYKFMGWVREIDSLVKTGSFRDLQILVSEGSYPTEYVLEVYGKLDN